VRGDKLVLKGLGDRVVAVDGRLHLAHVDLAIHHVLKLTAQRLVGLASRLAQHRMLGGELMDVGLHVGLVARDPLRGGGQRLLLGLARALQRLLDVVDDLAAVLAADLLVGREQLRRLALDLFHRHDVGVLAVRLAPQVRCARLVAGLLETVGLGADALGLLALGGLPALRDRLGGQALRE
jgi:hypothetical protein